MRVGVGNIGFPRHLFNHHFALPRAFLLLCPLLLAGCEEPAEKAQDLIRSVKTLEIGEIAASRERQLAGKLAAVQSSQLSFALPGSIESVMVEPGANVTKGQVLALLDKRVFELALTAAQARLSSARATMEEQRLNYNRQRTLFAKGIVARAALDRAEASLGTARANVDAARSEVDQAKRDIERTALSAPFDGRIAERLIEPFQEIATGQAAFVIEGADGFEADVLVPETMIRQVAYGDAVRLSFPTLEDTEVYGTVAEIGSRTDAGNAFPVSIRIERKGEGPSLALRAGMTVRATFSLSAGEAAAGYLIPISAIVLGQKPRSDGKKPEVGQVSTGERREAPLFVYDKASQTVRRVTVRVGDLRGNLIAVYEGLSPGDRVVVAGVAFLRDGMPARLWTPDL